MSSFCVVVNKVLRKNAWCFYVFNRGERELMSLRR
jgi:hypothetical protein